MRARGQFVLCEEWAGGSLPSPFARGPSGAMGMVVVVVWCFCWLLRYLFDSSRDPNNSGIQIE